MVKKAILLKENEKLKRCLFIYQNIGVGVNASTLEKEMAAKTATLIIITMKSVRSLKLIEQRCGTTYIQE